MKFIIKDKWLKQTGYPVTHLIKLLRLDRTKVTIQKDSIEMEIPDETIGKLTSREQKVISLRYGKGLTREAIGKEFDVTRERARQIECKALRKLKILLTGVGSNGSHTIMDRVK